MAYEVPSDEGRSRKLRQDLSVVRNIALYQNAGVNADNSAFGGGARDTPTAALQGMSAWNPISHVYANDGSGKAHITLQSSTAIVDGAATPINLYYIDGVINNGQILTIRPAIGKSLVLKKASSLDNLNGNLNLVSDVTLTDKQLAILQFFTDQGTSTGMFILLGTAGASGSTLWSNITIDTDKDMLGFGLSNLNYIAFDAAITQYIDGVIGTSINYDTPTGTTHRFKINAVTKYEMGSGNLNFNNQSIAGLNDINFNVAGQLILSDTTGLQFLVPTGDEFQWYVNGFENMFLNSTSLRLLSTFLEFDAANRTIFKSSGLVYDVPTGETHNFRINSVDKLKINTANVDLFNSSLQNLNDISFNVSGQLLLSDSTGLQFLIPTGDEFQWYVNGIEKLFLNATSFQLKSLALEFDAANRLLFRSSGIVYDIPTGEGHRFRINSVDKITITSGNMDFNNISINGLNDINFNVSGQLILSDTTGIQLLVPTGDSFNVYVNGFEQFVVSKSIVSLKVLAAGDTITIDDGTGARITYDWSTDDFFPVDNVASLGKSGKRWTEVWAVNGTIQTSFSKFKKDIKEQDCADCLAVCEALTPIKFRWDTDKLHIKDPSKKQRMQTQEVVGFNADALKTLMPEAVAGDDGVYTNAVISSMLGAIQNLSRQIKELKKGS